jgi:four helix bundle protein
MARSSDDRDLIVWQKAMALARQACALTAGLPKDEAYGLLSQMRRAAVSIPSNIAEGHGRLTDLQFRHFLGNARGSLNELEKQSQLAADLGYLDKQSVRSLMDQGTEVARLINGLIASLRQHNVSAVANSADTANAANAARKGTAQ